MSIDKHSATWVEVKEWAEDHLETARKMLEVPNTPLSTTENLRGSITMLRELLALSKPRAPAPQFKDRSYGLQGHGDVD